MSSPTSQSHFTLAFTTTRAVAYCFLPSIAATRFIAGLK
jgi:hypothetical protein